MAARNAALALILTAGLAVEAADITPAAAALRPRATDPELVGYISQSGSYAASRTCDYPQTISTSAGYVQCCGPSGTACPFFTACSSNVLLAAGTSVPCGYEPSLTCNVALVLPTPSAAAGSYLACWQTSLGDAPFTFVQMTGAGSAAATPTSSSSTPDDTVPLTSSAGPASGSGSGSAAASGSAASSGSGSGSDSGSSSPSSSASSAGASSTSSGAAGSIYAAVNGGVMGAVAMIAQAFL